MALVAHRGLGTVPVADVPPELAAGTCDSDHAVRDTLVRRGHWAFLAPVFLGTNAAMATAAASDSSSSTVTYTSAVNAEVEEIGFPCYSLDRLAPYVGVVHRDCQHSSSRTR